MPLGISNILQVVFQDINRLLQGFDFLPHRMIIQGTPGSKTLIKERLIILSRDIITAE